MKKFIFSISIIICMLFIASLILSGCATNNTFTPTQTSTQTPSSQTPSSQNQNSAPRTLSVDIRSFAFSPNSITINAGDTIVWTNFDSAPHTVTSDSGSELNSDRLSNGQTYSHTFSTAGEFDYHCVVHPNMHGKVIVQ